MMKFLPFLLLVMGLSSVEAQSWSRKSACFFPDANNHRAPGWICGHSGSRNLISAVGYSRQSGMGFSFVRRMAIADARVQLARQLQGQCGKRNASDAILRNSRILNLQRSPSGGFYARVGLRPSDLTRGC